MTPPPSSDEAAAAVAAEHSRGILMGRRGRQAMPYLLFPPVGKIFFFK